MRSSKKSLFEACENQQMHVDPLSAIYGSLRDDSQARGKRTYVWAELLAMFQRRFTVRTLFCKLPANRRRLRMCTGKRGGCQPLLDATMVRLIACMSSEAFCSGHADVGAAVLHAELPSLGCCAAGGADQGDGGCV